MMSSYHSDDEDDHMVDSEDKVVDETESSRVTLETTGSKQSQLDEQVADFLQVSVSLETVVFKISVCVWQMFRDPEQTLRILVLLFAVGYLVEHPICGG